MKKVGDVDGEEWEEKKGGKEVKRCGIILGHWAKC